MQVGIKRQIRFLKFWSVVCIALKLTSTKRKLQIELLNKYDNKVITPLS
jgi:hypothetical protein